MSALTDYIDAWKAIDTESIVATVTPDVVVTESFGPVYYGQERIREWADKWSARGARVLNWVVSKEVTVGDTIVAEWRFDYHDEDEDHSFEGSTIATVRDGKLQCFASTPQPLTYTRGKASGSSPGGDPNSRKPESAPRFLRRRRTLATAR